MLNRTKVSPEARALMAQGDRLLDAGRESEGADAYAQAQQRAQADGDLETLAMAAGNLGNLALHGGRPAEALDRYIAAAEAYRAIGDPSWEAAMLTSRGNALEDLGRLDDALRQHREAVAVAEAAGATDWHGRALNNQGNVLAHLQDFPAAAQAHEQALQLAETLHDDELAAMARRALTADRMQVAALLETHAAALDDSTDSPERVSAHVQAYKAWAVAGDTDGQARCLARLIDTLVEVDELDPAESLAHQLVALALRADLLHARCVGLGQLGEIARKRGRYALALRLLGVQRDLAEGDSELADQALAALQRLTAVYLDLGRTLDAVRCLIRWNTLSDQTEAPGDLPTHIGVLDLHARVSLRLGRTAEARTMLESGLAQLPGNARHASALRLRLTLAGLLMSQGEREAAIEQLHVVAERAGYQRLLQGHAWLMLGRLSLAEGDPALAERGAAIATTLAEQRGDKALLVQAYVLTGEIALDAGGTDDALHAAQEAVQAAQIQGDSLDDTSSVALFAGHEAAFTLLQRALLADGKTDEALLACERSRARALSQLLVQRHADARTARDVKASLANAAFDSLLAHRGRVGGHSSIDTDMVRQTIATLALPRVEPEPRPQPTRNSLCEVARQHDATLLVFSLLGARQLSIWVVQAQGVVHREAPAPTDATWDAAVHAMLAQLADPLAPIESLDAGLRELHRCLVEPVADLLPHDGLLCIVPDGALFQLPFAALTDANGEPLLAHHRLCHAASVEVLSLSLSAAQRLPPRTGASALVVGDPDPLRLPEGWDGGALNALAFARQEARDVAARLGAAAPLLGEQATLAAVLARLPQASVVHLAAHALLDADMPTHSAVLLSAPEGTADKDCSLTVQQLQQQNLQAALVVLSACSTAMGPVSDDGVSGFARALLVAGVPSAVLALWPVADTTTWELMLAFHTRLASGEPVALALQQAMLAQRALTPDPRDWAGMVLYGQAGTALLAKPSGPAEPQG